MKIKFEIIPKNNEEIEFLKILCEEIQNQNMIEKKS